MNKHKVQNEIDAANAGGRAMQNLTLPLISHMLRLHILLICSLLAGASLGAQDAATTTAAAPALNLAAPPGCNAELRGSRPKVYIGNFLVTYGKRDMGKAIGDYMAERFQADGRFDIIPREEIDTEMTPFLKNKKLKAGDYLQKTLDLATERKADCVIFGRISKKGTTVSFLVRMASVTDGTNVRKVDTDVERDDALKFLESIGDQFVSYFVTAPPPVIAKPKDEEDKSKSSDRKKIYAGATGNFSLPFGFIKDGFSYGIGGELLFGVRDMGVKNLHFGISAEYLQYVVKDTKFTSLNATTAMGFIGYEIGLGKMLSVTPALYAGFGFGTLAGELESQKYQNAQYALGVRLGLDINKSLSIIAEPRMVLKADSTYILSYTNTVGVLWRF